MTPTQLDQILDTLEIKFWAKKKGFFKMGPEVTETFTLRQILDMAKDAWSSDAANKMFSGKPYSYNHEISGLENITLEKVEQEQCEIESPTLELN